MERLEVRFSNEQKQFIADLAEEIGVHKSKIARAAMYLGLKIVDEERKAETKDKIKKFVQLNDYKSTGDI